MARKRILWQMFPSVLLVVLAALLAAGWAATRAMHRFYLEQMTADLEARARVFAAAAGARLADAAEVAGLCRSLGAATATRFTVILADGRVAGDSDEDPSHLDNHANRPEVREALAGRTGVSRRTSGSFRKAMLYVAVPAAGGAAVRAAVPVSFLREGLRALDAHVAAGVLVIAVIAVGAAFWMSRRLARPLEELRRGAERLAAGDLAARLPVPDTDEVGCLAEVMNRLAADLEGRLATIERLETVRRDFVANVSHELKTPITAVRGYVETLLADPPPSPAEARKFLEIALKHADRLNAIIEDLLVLADLDREEGRSLPRETVALGAVAAAAADVCRSKADAKGIAVTVYSDGEIAASANGPLLEQALINLVDNAIKYSEPGRPVTVMVERDGGGAVIRVRDEGCGIPAEHIGRLFERFYRVDKARSRTLGGTGLGLAIVKHIVEVHGGRISVESEPGKGSTFSLHLPTEAGRAGGGTTAELEKC
ncbi:MAG: ATP-binding protein [Planctomycetota bacterium]